jgi:hypothetical protein
LKISNSSKNYRNFHIKRHQIVIFSNGSACWKPIEKSERNKYFYRKIYSLSLISYCVHTSLFRPLNPPILGDFELWFDPKLGRRLNSVPPKVGGLGGLLRRFGLSPASNEKPPIAEKVTRQTKAIPEVP